VEARDLKTCRSLCTLLIPIPLLTQLPILRLCSTDAGQNQHPFRMPHLVRLYQIDHVTSRGIGANPSTGCVQKAKKRALLRVMPFFGP